MVEPPLRRLPLLGLIFAGILTSAAVALVRSDGEAEDRSDAGALAAKGASSSIGAGFDSDLAVPVEVDTIERGTLVLEVSATGQAEAWRRATISARVAGQVVALPRQEGDRVAAGTLLVRVDPREYALAAERAEADLAEAQTRFREMTLFDERIADPAVRTERAEAARARSGLARAEIALKRARLDLGNTAVTAPFAGLVADVVTTRGEVVSTGQEILTLVDPSPIRVEVQVPESELGWLAVGNGATVHLPALPAVEFRGRITAINPVVDPGSRTGRVAVLLSNPAGTIRPGMYARVVLEGRSYEDRTLVRREALIERDGRTLVFLFEPIREGLPGEGRAKWAYVTPGLGNSRVVELVETEESPLPEPGTVIIVGGHLTLVHDARVRIAE